MEGYKVTIKETSREFSARERIMLKDTSNAIKLDQAVTPDSPVLIEPDAFAVLSIHNEKSDNVDYEVYVILDTAGNKFVTGSSSFWESFQEIWSEMLAEEEPYQIEARKIESKNYKGKHFLSCSII